MAPEADAANRKFFLTLIYVIPSYLLYFLILYTIFLSRVKFKFAGSFMQIFGISALVYLASSLAYYFEIRIVKTPMFLPFVKSWGIRNFLITILHMLIWYLANATHLLSLALSFNRFTVFLLRIGYQKFWNKYLRRVLAFCLLAPIALIWHIPLTDIYVALNNVFDPHSLRYITEGKVDAVPWMNNPRNTAILMTITSILSFGMNVYVLVKLFSQKLCSKKVSQIKGKISPQDIKLFFYTLLIFGTEIINCGQQYAFVAATDYNFIIAMFEVQTYLIDIITLAPAWFILFTHKILRRQIGILFGLVKYEEPTVPSTTLNSFNSNSTARIVPVSIQ